MIRVLVVDDSLTLRKTIAEVLEEHPDFEVVGEARDGKDAIHQAEKLRPDVITMDMMMPEMTGLSATEYIMAHCPTPILIVSSSTNRGELMKTYDALAAGAVNVYDKPTGKELEGVWENGLIAELKLVHRVPVIRHLKGKVGAKKLRPSLSSRAGKYNLIVIGASTGGPQAVLSLLKALPPDIRVPILCVIHLKAGFSTSLAEWLSINTNLKVEFAQDGQVLTVQKSTQVFLAPADFHLTLESGKLRLRQTPPQNYCRPSVDVLFESVVCSPQYKAIGILLTGMGKDGAKGLKSLRDSGALTIAQDESSSIIYGMPKVAVDMGAAIKVLHLDDISREIIELIG